MQRFEYKVVNAPRRPVAKRQKGVRTPQDRFAKTLTDLINEEARGGWEYLRADTLPVEQKSGMLSSAKEVFQTVLIFRRALSHAVQPEPGSVTELRSLRTDSQTARPLGPAERE